MVAVVDGGPPVSDTVSTWVSEVVLEAVIGVVTDCVAGTDDVTLVDAEGCCVADVVRAVVVSDVDVDVDAGTETVVDTEGLGNKDRVCEWVVVVDTV